MFWAYKDYQKNKNDQKMQDRWNKLARPALASKPIIFSQNMQNNVAIFHNFNVFFSIYTFWNKNWLELNQFLCEKISMGAGVYLSKVGWPDNIKLLLPWNEFQLKILERRPLIAMTIIPNISHNPNKNITCKVVFVHELMIDIAFSQTHVGRVLKLLHK